jgi:ligand-binding sensor domain-containing protein
VKEEAIASQVVRTCVRAALLVALCAAAPQPASADWQNFRGARDGLADNQVLGILEDSEGALWFGTPMGASRFDGIRWKTERDSLPNLTVLSLIQDRAGAYWFGTQNGGLARFDGSQWTTFSSPGDLPSNQVEAILEDHAGDVWVGTPAGLMRYQRAAGAWVPWGTGPGELVHPHAWRIVEDRDFNLWIATPEGVSRLDPARTGWQSFTATPGALARDSVLSLAVDSTGAVWFGTDQGAFRYADGAWMRFRYADGLGDDIVTAILTDRSGRVWFGGYSLGLSRFDGRVWRQYRQSPDGVLGHILTLHQDRSGNLWVATTNWGLYRYDGAAWRNYFSTNTLTCSGRLAQSAPYQNVLGGNCIMGMLQDHRDDLWFVTADGGAARYDHTGRWSPWRRRPGVPLSDSLEAVFEDRAGRLWFGSHGSGVAQLDSARTTWQTFTRAQGLAGDTVYTVFQDHAGDFWFGTATGVSRWNEAAWQNALTGPGAGYGIEVRAIVEDALDRLWFRTSDGLYRLDAARTGWRRITTADGLADDSVTVLARTADGHVCIGTLKGLSVVGMGGWSNYLSFGALADSVVYSVFEEESGRLWVGLENGAARLQFYNQPEAGYAWTYFPRQTFPSTPIRGIFEDDLHTLWLSTFEGLVRYNGEAWRTYDTGDGLAANWVTGFLQDVQGHMWLASYGGLAEHELDRVAPQTVLLSMPAPLTPSQDVDIVFGAGYGEAADLTYSYAWDGGSDSPWSPDVAWSRKGLADGPHALMVRARDWAHNADPTPALLAWEVDATPPNAILSAPVFGQPVRDALEVSGTASDERFRGYRVEARPAGGTRWSIPIDSASTPVHDTLLARWDTRGVPEGNYDLRLAVTDTLGLVGVAQVTVIVDNQPPWADVTTPVRVSTLTGGEVFTTGSEVHLYFPPRAFERDAIVTVIPADPPPGALLPPGAAALGPGYDVAWSAPRLEKAATIEMKLPDTTLAAGSGSPAIYVGHGDEDWTRLGGTLDGVRRRLSAAITAAGRYAVVLETGEHAGVGGLAEVELTPRVFSPSGRFASETVAISFTLARAAPATVTVYNRAGRRIRQLISGQPLSAGANLVRWDGRDEDGRIVKDGVYLVGVEALGETQKRAVAVVR